MKKKEFIEKLQEWKQELIEDVIPFYESGNRERGRLAYNRWKERFTAFLEKNAPGEVDRFKMATTHIVGIAYSSKRPYEAFVREGGRRCLAFIEDLGEAVSKGHIELQEKGSTESPTRPKDGSLRPQSMQQVAEQTNVEARAELTRIKGRLDQLAEKYARKVAFAYVGFLILVGVLLIVLTIIFGWDRVEPWTYFIGGLATIGSYVYFVVTQREFSPIRIYKRFVESAQEKTYQRFGFDLQTYEKLIEQ